MASGRDRISELPANVLDHILGFLPIKDAAKTSVLSTIWRDVWSSLTKLNFDNGFFHYIGMKYSGASEPVGMGSYACYLKYVKASTTMGSYVVNKVLQQHNGTIRKFVLGFLYADRFHSFDFDKCLLLVIRKGVEEMHICLEPDIYKLPNCVFSCSTLKRLHLSGVIVEPMKSLCILPNVDSLCFEYVDFGLVNPHQDCAIDVPVVQNLSFIACQNMFNLNITAPKLCSLTIKFCSSCGLDKFLPVNLDLRSISTLDLEGSDLQEFVKDFTRMGFRLNDVKNLKLSLHHKSDVTTPAIVHLLQLCPNLCRLDIDILWVKKMTTRYKGALSGLLSKLHVTSQTNKMLHVLKFTSFRGSHPEILFIRWLLACFSSLERVFIIRHEFDCREEFGIMQERLHFVRVFTKVDIILLNYA